MKKGHSKLSENEPENIPQDNLFVKAIKRLKTDFDRKRQLNWWNHPFAICLNQGRFVGWIRAVGGCVRVGETV